MNGSIWHILVWQKCCQIKFTKLSSCQALVLCSNNYNHANISYEQVTTTTTLYYYYILNYRNISSSENCKVNIVLKLLIKSCQYILQRLIGQVSIFTQRKVPGKVSPVQPSRYLYKHCRCTFDIMIYVDLQMKSK